MYMYKAYPYLHPRYSVNVYFTILSRGEYATVQWSMVAASAWQDRKIVTVMSTNTQPDASGSVLRRQRDGSRIQVPCPQSIIAYNQHMGGVDRGDQLRGYYTCRTKSRKFYKYIFYFFYDVTVTNCYVLYKEFAPNPTLTNLKDFRVQLAKEIIGDYCSRRRPGRHSSLLAPLSLQHFPVKCSPETPGQRKRGRCARCTSKYKRCDSQWFCRECGVWLCHSGDPQTDCFLQWHKGINNEE